MAVTKHTVDIHGKRLQLTNLDKVLYAETGTTKADIIDYYRRIADVMLPHCRNRPVTRKRWPNGVSVVGDDTMFFQKDLGDGAPDWVQTRPIQHSDHVNEYPLANDAATLVWFAQLAALELHVPQWRFDSDGRQAHPDRMVFDLDPGEGVGLRECAEIASNIRNILQGMGLEAVPVTSGSKGIHLYAPLDGSAPSRDISRVAHELAKSLEADHPDTVTSTMKRAERAGKVFIDWSQNNENKTTIAPYSLRGRSRPMVACPRTWRELGSPHLRHLEMNEVLERVERRGDPLSALLEQEPVTRDRLEMYRSKRDPQRTREPIPSVATPQKADEAPVFVIQRHDARRLHYDFRLEHDGVLVSWALPRGVPLTSGRNHLAVQTEDHPMEYRFFEGSIPKGEYGGGEVEIWDSGTIEIEKWRSDSVTVTIHGQVNGALGGIPRRYALFRAGKSDADWLIHLTKEQPEPSKSEQQHQRLPEQPSPISPMLATPSEENRIARLPLDKWGFELKWDGYRAIVHVENDRVHVHSRNLVDLTERYPAIQHFPTEIGVDSATFDGEIVALNESGVPDFSLLQGEEPDVTYLVFDVLEINGIETISLPYRQRRELLDGFDMPEGGSWRIPPVLSVDTAEQAIEVSRERGLEGVVAKRLWSTYRPGIRSEDWLKLPFTRTAEVVIIGWRHSEVDAHGFASLLVGTLVDGNLKYAGRVGTGFTSKDRQYIRERLSPSERATAPIDVPSADARDATWVEPELVAEVTIKGITSSGKLRHASWRGFRTDKKPSTVSRLE